MVSKFSICFIPVAMSMQTALVPDSKAYDPQEQFKIVLALPLLEKYTRGLSLMIRRTWVYDTQDGYDVVGQAIKELGANYDPGYHRLTYDMPKGRSYDTQFVHVQGYWTFPDDSVREQLVRLIDSNGGHFRSLYEDFVSLGFNAGRVARLKQAIDQVGGRLVRNEVRIQKKIAAKNEVDLKNLFYYEWKEPTADEISAVVSALEAIFNNDSLFEGKFFLLGVKDLIKERVARVYHEVTGREIVSQYGMWTYANMSSPSDRSGTDLVRKIKDFSGKMMILFQGIRV